MKNLKRIVSVFVVALLMMSFVKETKMYKENDPLKELIEILKKGGYPGPFYPYSDLPVEKTQSNTLIKDFEYLGVEHNRMLDEVFTYIKKNNLSKSTTANKKMIRDFIIKLVQESQNRIKSDDNDNNNKITQVIVNLTFSKSFDGIDLSKTSNKKEFSSFYKQIYSVITQKKDIVNSLSEIEKQIEKSTIINRNEKVVLLSYSIISRYSFKYWTENSTKWGKEFSMEAKGCCDGFFAADGKGGLAAGVGAAAVNLIPGAGQVGYCGAIIGGAVGNSVLSLFE